MRPVRPATTPRAWRLVTIGIIGAVLAGSWLAFGPATRLYEASPLSWPSEPFSSELWRKVFRGERFQLFKDLDKQKLIRGRDKAALVELLGPPDREAPDGRALVYILQEWDGRNDLQNAVWLLQIDLDEKGHEAGYENPEGAGEGGEVGAGGRHTDAWS